MKTAIRIVVLLMLVFPSMIMAQDYPNKTIRLIVGYPPGGGNDIAARLIAPKLSEGLGQPVVVENRGGAATNIAQELVAKAAPDGYTLLLSSPAVAINRSLYQKLPFDSLRDFTGVSMFAVSPNILAVNPSVPAKTVQELIALAAPSPEISPIPPPAADRASIWRESCSTCGQRSARCMFPIKGPPPRSPR